MTQSPRTPQRQQGADRPRPALRTVLRTVLAAIVIAGSAASGALVVDLASRPPARSGPPSPTPTAVLPVVDVEGNDLPDLARYPGAVRTAYVREKQGSTTVTALEYVTSAAVDDVRAFYRRIFREHDWELVELDFSDGDWTFLVERGRRAALVAIEQREHVAIEIELEVRAPAATPAPNPTPTPAPRPAPPPPPPPPGDDDDDDDDGDDSGDDDD